MNRDRLDEIISLITGLLSEAELPFRCIETEWNQHDRILRVFIDHVASASDEVKAKGIDMTDCVSATKAINRDEKIDELIKGAFNLEVSSPGVERPVRLSEDFTRLDGETLEVRVKEPVEGKRKAVGKLVLSNDSDKFGIIEGNNAVWEFDLSNLLKAHVVYDWSK